MAALKQRGLLSRHNSAIALTIATRPPFQKCERGWRHGSFFGFVLSASGLAAGLALRSSVARVGRLLCPRSRRCSLLACAAGSAFLAAFVAAGVLVRLPLFPRRHPSASASFSASVLPVLSVPSPILSYRVIPNFCQIEGIKQAWPGLFSPPSQTPLSSARSRPPPSLLLAGSSRVIVSSAAPCCAGLCFRKPPARPPSGSSQTRLDFLNCARGANMQERAKCYFAPASFLLRLSRRWRGSKE